MKLIQLFEADSDFDIDKFESDCQFILKMLDGDKYIPYRGTNAIKEWEIKKWRERFSPRDSSEDLHNKANELFMKKFGKKFRNWSFMTGDSDQASAYGTPKMIFPIGEFEWACAPSEISGIRDLTSLYWKFERQLQNSSGWSIKRKLQNLDRNKETEAIRHTVDALAHTNWEVNTNFLECLKSGHEIMFKCNQFYSITIRTEAANKVRELLRTKYGR